MEEEKGGNNSLSLFSILAPPLLAAAMQVTCLSHCIYDILLLKLEIYTVEGLNGRGLGLCDLFTYSGTFGVKTNEAEVSLKKIIFLVSLHL